MSDQSQASESMATHHSPFGNDPFGRRAESFARLFGTPGFLIGQTIVVTLWITINVVAVAYRWDPYPFILLNLVFSLQAAYAAPLILLAQTRQADRDKLTATIDEQHRETLANRAIQLQETSDAALRELKDLIAANTELTQQVERLTSEIHARVVVMG